MMTVDSERDRKLVALAKRRRHCLVTWQEIASLGITEEGVASRMRRGMLERVFRGVYRIAGANRGGWIDEAAAVCVAVGPHAVLSHDSAARLWGFDLPFGTTIELTIPLERKVTRNLGNVIVHRTRNLPQRQKVRRQDLLVTSAARTFIDLAPRFPEPVLTKALDDAMIRELVRPHILAPLLNDPLMRSRPGTGKLRRALAASLEFPAAQSVAELLGARILIRAGLRPPAQQYKVFDREEFVARLDFAWPELKVGVEIEGRRFHGTPVAHDHDTHRFNHLAVLGWIIIRVTMHNLQNDPDRFVKRLREALERAAKQR